MINKLFNMKKEIKNLVEISNKIGRHQQFAQGGGGNTSVKLTDSIMAIKASGYSLKNMKTSEGIVEINYKTIQDYFKTHNTASTEDEFNHFLQSTKLHKSEIRPSIEAGFHAILPYKYIIHTHSVYANLLCCSKEGKNILNTVIPNATWIPYANPGKEITMQIYNFLQENSRIIFMQNHGIIVCGDTAQDVYDLHHEINQKIINHFNLTNTYSTNIDEVNLDKLNQNIIFPDQIVYLLSEKMQNTQAGIETLIAANFIINTIKKLNLSLNIISYDNVEYVKNMESEKYRQSLIKK